MATNILKAGQQIGVKWREAKDIVQLNIEKLRLNPLTNGTSVEVSAYVTFVDARGVSVYIARGPKLGGDIEAFIPVNTVMWQSYFVAYDHFVSDYASRRHFTKIFPKDFV